MTREFNDGDELLPGVVVAVVYTTPPTIVVRIPSSVTVPITRDMAEHLASIGDRLRELEVENERLKESLSTSGNTERILRDEIVRITSTRGEWEPGVLRMKVAELTEEIERLNAICPTEWRTGIPDWDSLDPEATIEWIDQKYSPNHSSCEFVKNFLTGGDDEDGWEGYIHRIIPYVPPPPPERVYTEADLPKVEGCRFVIRQGGRTSLHWQISLKDTNGFDGYETGIPGQHATQSDAIRAAREWFRKIQSAEVPE